MTRILALKDMHTVTIFGDKRPEYQKTTSTWMCNGYGVVYITLIIFPDGKEKFCFTADLNNQKYSGYIWETLDSVLDVHDCQLGEWLDDDRATLTPEGEQEAALSSSIPYLFPETPEMGL